MQPKDYFQLVGMISKTAKQHVEQNVRVWGKSVQKGFNSTRPILLIMGGSHLVKHSIRISVTGQRSDRELQRELE